MRSRLVVYVCHTNILRAFASAHVMYCIQVSECVGGQLRARINRVLKFSTPHSTHEATLSMYYCIPSPRIGYEVQSTGPCEW